MHHPSCTTVPFEPAGWGAANPHSTTSSSASGAKGKDAPETVSGRSRKRQMIASEKSAPSFAAGITPMPARGDPVGWDQSAADGNVSIGFRPDRRKGLRGQGRYRGYCRTCGADTSPRNGKGDAYLYCRRCRPGAAERKWTHERVREAMQRWGELYGRAPSSYDWSRTHARTRGAQALRRLERGEWPSAATVSGLYGTWAAALARLLRE